MNLIFTNQFYCYFQDNKTQESILSINKALKTISIRIAELEQKNLKIQNQIKIKYQDNELKEKTISNLKLILNKKILKLKEIGELKFY